MLAYKVFDTDHARFDIDRAPPHKRTFEISNKMFYTLEFWIADHSRIPTFEYMDTRVAMRTIAKWKPGEPYYKQMEQALMNPGPELLERILAEKNTPIQLCRLSLVDLEKGKAAFKAEDYEDLRWRFLLDLNTAILWRYINEAYFGYKVLVNHPSKPLLLRVNSAIDAMEAWADITEAEFGEDIAPSEPQPTRNLAKELREKVAELKL